MKLTKEEIQLFRRRVWNQFWANKQLEKIGKGYPQEYYAGRADAFLGMHDFFTRLLVELENKEKVYGRSQS